MFGVGSKDTFKTNATYVCLQNAQVLVKGGLLKFVVQTDC